MKEWCDMLIKNAEIYGEDCRFHRGELYVKDGKISQVVYTDLQNHDEEQNMIDAAGCYLIPGLIDIHFHGCVGADICDGSGEDIQKMADYEASVGVTSICPATMTIPQKELEAVMECAGSYQGSGGAKLAGINMEGPFISAKKKGAQAEENIMKCDVDFFRQLQEKASGLIRLVDIAPEEDGAMDFIREVKDEAVVSIAHSAADYQTAATAFATGASHVTHLYNAMPPFGHREPGVIGAAQDADHVHVELICDGVHIHPSVIRATFKLFGQDRIILISDSMRAAGLADGEYSLGGQAVSVKGNLATLHDGTIAGSVTNLMDCMKYAVKEAGIPLETAVACATGNPAKEIGIYNVCGSISPGKDADLVLLDRDLNVKAVFVQGKKVK